SHFHYFFFPSFFLFLIIILIHTFTHILSFFIFLSFFLLIFFFSSLLSLTRFLDPFLPEFSQSNVFSFISSFSSFFRVHSCLMYLSSIDFRVFAPHIRMADLSPFCF